MLAVDCLTIKKARDMIKNKKKNNNSDCDVPAIVEEGAGTRG